MAYLVGDAVLPGDGCSVWLSLVFPLLLTIIIINIYCLQYLAKYLAGNFSYSVSCIHGVWLLNLPENTSALQKVYTDSWEYMVRYGLYLKLGDVIALQSVLPAALGVRLGTAIKQTSYIMASLVVYPSPLVLPIKYIPKPMIPAVRAKYPASGKLPRRGCSS
jgi:hypothetical protein